MSVWDQEKRDRELEEEVQSHLNMASQDRIERGEDSATARTSAHRELGNVGLIKEVTRSVWGWSWVGRWAQDIRYGVRVLRRDPSSSLVSVLTLALGISASTAIFSVVYGVLLRPLPFHKPEQIVSVGEVTARGQISQVSDQNFLDLRAQGHALQGLAEYNSLLDSVSGGREPRRVSISSVSHDFLNVMGVGPVVGRPFADEEQHVGAPPVALVSYAYWKQDLNATNDLSGVRLNFGGHSSAVVGVLPPGFRFPEDTDIWVPRELDNFLPSRTAHNWKLVGRLLDGASIDQARSETSALAHQLKKQFGQNTNMEDVDVSPLQLSLTREVRPALLVLLGAVGFLLLVGCANVMNMLLAQAAARQGEIAIRTALGASRARLIRQFLAETLVLSLAGGIVGLVGAFWGVKALVAMAPPGTPRLEEVSLSLPVLLFAFAISVLVAVGLGTFTALRASADNLHTALIEGGRGMSGTASHGFGRTIIALQLSITLVLLVGAGLLGRSLLRVLAVDPGFRTEQIVTMDLALPGVAEPAEKVRRVQFLNDLMRKLRDVPGVAEVGGTSGLPLTGGLSNGTYVVLTSDRVPSMPDLMRLFQDPVASGTADYCVASEGYFRTLAIPLLSGRLFEDRDTADAPQVAVVSEALAKEKWKGLDPLGRMIEFGNMDNDLRPLRVIGIVGDIRVSRLERPPRPTIYVNYRQRPQKTYTFDVVARTAGPPSSVISSAHQIVRDLDPNVPPSFNTFTEVFASSTKGRRFNLLLIGTFAITALLLAMAGIYGVLAYSVERRTREMGVRIALGASPGNVLGLVVGQSMRTAIIGVLIGLVGSFALMRLMQSLRSLLFEVSPNDPLTFGAVAAVLALVALLASYLPARRATKVDPMVALRSE